MAWGKPSPNRVKELIEQLQGKASKPSPTSLFLLPTFLKLNPSDIVSLSEVLAMNTTLTELNISGHELGVDGSLAFGRALSQNNSIRSLCVGSSLFGKDIQQVESVFIGLKSNNSLTKLDLQNKSLDHLGVEILADFMNGNHTLTELNLSRNELSDLASAYIRSLIYSTQLNELDISQNALSPIAFSIIFSEPSPFHLTSLNLSQNNIGNAGIQTLSKYLKSFPAQSKQLCLIMEDSEIEEFGGESLASIVWWIKKLSISGNPKCGRALTKSLVVESRSLQRGSDIHLESLSLSKCGLKDDGIFDLWSSFNHVENMCSESSFKRIELLDISQNEIGLRGCISIAKLLCLKGMEKLNVSGNAIEEAGAKEICSVLGSQSSLSLKELNVCGNNLGFNGVKAVLETLLSTPPSSLRVLEIMDNFELKEGESGLESLLDNLLKSSPELDVKWR